MKPPPRRVTALAGGVGAARMLSGLAAVVGQAAITAIVNTGDDMVLHGLHISPDIDTVTYTLAGAANSATGWGLSSESWTVMASLQEFEGAAPGPGLLTWFNLGDRDLATHLFRTGRLGAGATLSEVTAEVARRFGVHARLLPMTDDPVETRLTIEPPAGPPDVKGSFAGLAAAPPPAPGTPPGAVEVGFQEYFVGLRHDVAVRAVRFVGASSAVPAPGVLDAVAGADIVVICPSNPIVSIGPVLAVPGIADAVARRRETTVAVSPIIAGKALKGPADRMLDDLGYETSAVGVARLWAPFAAALVVDAADADLAPRVEAEGARCIVAPSVMSGPAQARALAEVVLGRRP
ncbi:MAG: 2-phospho-L-lactate transferase CofD family protein [Acidimicrobiales bacterium]